ncbi:MAG: hypothetical protein ACJA1A_003705, partial [Saprospiraceae bacterium]
MNKSTQFTNSNFCYSSKIISNQIYRMNTLMKFFIAGIILFTNIGDTYGQYIETFAVPNKGVLAGPCSGSDGTTCTSNDFTGVNWVVNGDLSGVDSGDFISSDGTDLSFEDVDEEVCFETPLLDISGVAGNFSISADMVWTGFDSDDYIDLEYQIDEGVWVQVPNAAGGGDNTIEYVAPAANNDGSMTVIQTGLSGTTYLSIRVCTDFNLYGTFENVSIDNVSAPENGIMVASAVSFTAPADLCVDAGNQTGLGGGTPGGGVYSGAGVTDGGNGMTYSFNPAGAGVGTHTITYTESGNAASDDIEVFALPTVTFTGLTDVCINAGVQNNLGGGSPFGGIYSGPGVTDDGNGMTFDFDPVVAGVGTHIITYTFTDVNGCTNSDSDDVEVFALPTVTFTVTPVPTVCVMDASVTGLGGGAPTGGVYSGIGVTDEGNGMTFTFDPTASSPAGGNITVMYTFTDANGCTNSASDDIFVNPICCPVAFTGPADLCLNVGVQTGLSGGTPVPGGGETGIYSGAGVTDDGNGMTYSFDPEAAGVGTHTITYTFNDGVSCINATASDMVEVFALPIVTLMTPAEVCITAGV